MSRGAFWLMLRRIAVFAACVDLVYLVAFFALGMPVLALVNLLSAGMYAAAYALLGRRRNLPAVALMWTEVMGHAGACTILLGWDSGTHYFLLVFLPAVAVSRSPRYAIAAMGFVLAAYLGLDAATQTIPVAYPLDPGPLMALRWLSITVVFVMFGYTARYYTQRVHEAEGRLYDLATVDPLSGLWNRRHFLQMAHAEIDRASRHGTPLALVLADIDHFKLVNDQHGHDTGDRVIQHVAGLMRHQARTGDLIGRWGGEEFVMLLPMTDGNGALELSERMRASVEQVACQHAGVTVPVTMSLGVCEVLPGQPLDHAFKNADAALYTAKNAGRNQVCVAPLALPARPTTPQAARSLAEAPAHALPAG
ncbi:GGDEF domain-containing protein [Ideonella sp.]|uniref:GGDEF domain-containing protein n=1 Tax=Ideonella sp. TaxID=1929293 RepID=UPI0035B4BB1E